MGLFKLFGLGYNTLRSKAAVYIYKNTGIDFTYPNIVQAKITNECNSKCKMCDVWRCKENEIPATIWINTFSLLKELYGNYKICFTGGEVFLKDDCFEIFEFCHKAMIPFGITTNGLLLNPDNIKQLLELEPLNINISLDSLNNNIYSSIRGVDILDRVKSNIDFLMLYIEKNHLKTKIFFKTVVNSYNTKELHLLANYAMKKKVAGITFDPIKRKRKIFLEEKIDEFERMIDIDMKTLNEEKSRLIRLKARGYNILNSERNITSWFLKYGNDQKYFCDAPLLRINIDNEGQIKFCDYTESFIGNIADDNLRIILQSEGIKAEKKKLSQCNEPCEYCIQRNLFDYYRLFLRYISS